jgi:O-6-methylguanine DNA methyltransferase
MIRYRIIPTPVGPFALMLDERGAIGANWLFDSDEIGIEGAAPDETILPDIADRLAAYVAGDSVSFDDVPTPDGPPFFRRCWEACRAIPPGETRRYAELAAMAGRGPGAARAAGQAMRRNPLPIVVPCHRVVASGGDLGGYGGSRDPESPSLAIKRWLLALERGDVNRAVPPSVADTSAGIATTAAR